MEKMSPKNTGTKTHNFAFFYQSYKMLCVHQPCFGWVGWCQGCTLIFLFCFSVLPECQNTSIHGMSKHQVIPHRSPYCNFSTVSTVLHKTCNSDQKSYRNIDAQMFSSFCFFRLTDQDFANITVTLMRNGTGDFAQEWWVLNQVKKFTSKNIGLELFVFSDKVSPPSLGFLAGYG